MSVVVRTCVSLRCGRGLCAHLVIRFVFHVYHLLQALDLGRLFGHGFDIAAGRETVHCAPELLRSCHGRQ